MQYAHETAQGCYAPLRRLCRYSLAGAVELVPAAPYTDTARAALPPELPAVPPAPNGRVVAPADEAHHDLFNLDL